MENPILQMLSKSRPLNQPNDLISMLQKSNNPQQLIQSLLERNPQVMNLIKQYGNGDPKAAFYAYAKQTGRDPEQILSMLRNFR